LAAICRSSFFSSAVKPVLPGFPGPLPPTQFPSAAGARNHIAGIGTISQIGCEHLDALRPDRLRSFLLEFRELQNSDFSGIVHYLCIAPGMETSKP
jgi:hypothetical protein